MELLETVPHKKLASRPLFGNNKTYIRQQGYVLTLSNWRYSAADLKCSLQETD